MCSVVYHTKVSLLMVIVLPSFAIIVKLLRDIGNDCTAVLFNLILKQKIISKRFGFTRKQEK